MRRMTRRRAIPSPRNNATANPRSTAFRQTKAPKRGPRGELRTPPVMHLPFLETLSSTPARSVCKQLKLRGGETEPASPSFRRRGVHHTHSSVYSDLGESERFSGRDPNAQQFNTIPRPQPLPAPRATSCGALRAFPKKEGMTRRDSHDGFPCHCLP